MADNIVTVGLLLRLEAAPGRENNIQNLPEGGDLDGKRGAEGHGVVRGRFGPSTFGIFDVFPVEEGREAHLSGRSLRR